LHEVCAEYGWRLDHWVILDDHYHLLATSRCGRDMARIIGKVHNRMAQEIHRLHPSSNREQERVWWNYWDYCPRTQREYDVRLCYLLNNPCKHGYVDRLPAWPWSSFHRHFATHGDAPLRQLFQTHREYRELVLPEDAVPGPPSL
jgi:putative transposase